MTDELWALYLRLQTDLAYNGSIDVDADVAVDPSPNGTLVIGPGGSGELRSLLATEIPLPLFVLTAYEPETIQIRGEIVDAIVTIGDIHDTPYRSGQFEFIYASNVLEHAFAPYIALMECRRILRPGGASWFVMPAFDGPNGGVSPFHLHCLTDRVWSELLKKTGFEIDSIVDVVGAEDPAVHYSHFRCLAVTPPPPHHQMLNALIARKTPH